VETLIKAIKDKVKNKMKNINDIVDQLKPYIKQIHDAELPKAYMNITNRLRLNKAYQKMDYLKQSEYTLNVLFRMSRMYVRKLE